MYNISGGTDMWPSRQQELLLRAALLRGEDAIEAWREWKSRVDVDHLDQGSHRLLPLLSRNLQILGVKDPLIDKFKGVHRRTWYANQLLFHNISAVVRSLHDAGIETLLLKGAALVLLYYKDYGLRPMNDFDLLVREENASAAVDILGNLGWRSPGPFTKTRIFAVHAHGFEDIAGREFDLHWHVLSECRYAHADDDFWEGAVSIQAQDMSTYALNPTDQLLHVCVHGAKYNPVPTVRWIADAMAIMNTSHTEIDWNRLLIQAQKRRLILPLRDTLNYLRTVLDAPIPNEILQSVQSEPVSNLERIEYTYNTQNCQHKPWPYLSTVWFHYLRSMGNTTPQHKLAKLAGFLNYLRCLWGVPYLWQMPFYVVFKSTQRIGRMTVWHKDHLLQMWSRES